MRARRHWTRLALTAGCAVLLTVVAALSSFRSASADPNSEPIPVTYSHQGTASPAPNAGVSAVSTLKRLLATVGTDQIESASVGPPPAGFQPTDDPSSPPPPGFAGAPWLYLTMRAPSDSAVDVNRAIWTGNILTGAMRDLLYAAGKKPIYSASVSLRLPDGSEEHDVGGWIGAVTPGQIFSSASDDEITSNITAAANQAGYRVASIDILHADQPAPAVVLTTDNPVSAATDTDALMQAIFGPIGTYEGEFLAVTTTDGTPIIAESAAYRTGVGGSWTNPAYGSVTH